MLRLLFRNTLLEKFGVFGLLLVSHKVNARRENIRHTAASLADSAARRLSAMR
jgi:hypothetical protein